MALRQAPHKLLRTSLIRMPVIRRFASASNLPKLVKDEIAHEQLLPNYDPPADSATGSLLAKQEPYMVKTYVRPSQMFIRGVGSVLYDMENRKYVDFTAGIAVNSLGHGDEHLCNLIFDQAKQVIHTSNLYHNPWTGELAALLVEKTKEHGAFHDASQVFICNSGSEANEAALKFARKVGKVVGGERKIGIVSFTNSFHGRTMGALSATPNPKYQKPFAPMVPGYTHGVYNDVAGINNFVTEETCGVIVEPIQGEGGVNVGSPDFLIALSKRCREVGAVLIYDEIQCGLGRTGDLWAHQFLPKEAHPDILTMAKALGNGFPIGATMVNNFVGEKIVTGDHGTTFGGNPLASRIGHHVFSRLSEKSLLKGVEAKSETFVKRLTAIKDKYPEVATEVRGRGLILGLQLTRDPTSLVKEARERGLLIITAGTNTVRFVPPLVIEEETMNKGLDIFEKAMKVFAESGNA
ncbi:acetylornithine and succinylornithine aminotransferase [Tuber magnatum]|uniref:acetylornithine transaminase n=1 Tax=Tuber magnatum TaxID=42249 RepID=A0A317SCM4_9PEZI|nr:acetylornithine and succinylornithine aminotransferase [Tuber magnatum]